MTNTNRVTKMNTRTTRTLTAGEEARSEYRNERVKKHNRNNRNTKRNWEA